MTTNPLTGLPGPKPGAATVARANKLSSTSTPKRPDASLRLSCQRTSTSPDEGPHELATELVYADNQIACLPQRGQDRLLGHFVAVGDGAVVHVDGLEAGLCPCRDHDRG